ncbi:MAG: hypothetical protein HOK67_16285 [Deltaproteobacteria bacterium]|jgi:hypothetical protein|nr:hypothetical protein [Deltaproteobacteria bacterium]MBT4644533.1 hypothetical protein [Deltaproteobacteria bacterium]MBT6501456.1 hypothetical protein [Deltaproteobacteria bacterium]MBT7151065.1 hypothetical protein [Deltaproteobacteria bacterium]MBT7713707.1 hypothetical protein [Deltaproteobacteria bacterium]
MTDTVAILYAPGSRIEKEEWLLRKFRNAIDRFNIGRTKIQVNPKIPIRNYWEYETDSLNTLIMGWGLISKPNWELLIPEPELFRIIRQFIAIDLYERKALDGRILEKPLANAGPLFSQEMKQNNRDLFFKGHFLQASTPYGLKKVMVGRNDIENDSSNPLYGFEPGESSEVEIIRTIFDLFVTNDYNRTEISTLLNAQGVKPPKRSNTWNTRIISSILESPFYTGANQYRGFIKYDVFPPIVGKSLYFEAQAKLSQINLIRRKKDIGL